MNRLKIFLPIALFSLLFNPSIQSQKIEKPQFKSELVILPSILISYGIVSLSIDRLRDWDYAVQEELQEHTSHKFTIDNYLLFAPALTVYALNAFDIKGKHQLKDRSIILLSSYLLAETFTLPLKYLTKRERPDGSNQQSFPSGHTTIAFASAEFLRMEYQDVSLWYGFAGYVMATSTGFLRMYNNKHWLSDVIAGAGFGILSTRIAYWVYPSINRYILKGAPHSTGIVMPYYNGKQVGASLVFKI